MNRVLAKNIYGIKRFRVNNKGNEYRKIGKFRSKNI